MEFMQSPDGSCRLAWLQPPPPQVLFNAEHFNLLI